MKWSNGRLYSGGKDGFVAVTDTKTLQVVNTISFDGVLIRAIDVKENEMVVGLRNGHIISCNTSG